MSLVKCGLDEGGSYIELKKPKGETPDCFIDDNGDVYEKIRIYEDKAELLPNVIPFPVERCVMCGAIIPEGSMVCVECTKEVMMDE